MKRLAPLIPLLTAAGILLAGNGVLGTMITLRADQEGFSRIIIGLMGTAYFAGFILACFTAAHFIRAVGHIRVFAALAAITSAATLAMLLGAQSGIVDHHPLCHGLLLLRPVPGGGQLAQ